MQSIFPPDDFFYKYKNSEIYNKKRWWKGTTRDWCVMDKWEMRLNLNVTQKRFAFQSDNQHLHTKKQQKRRRHWQINNFSNNKKKLCNVKEWMREDLNPLVSVKCSTFILPSITSHLSTHSLHCCCYLRHLMCRFPFFSTTTTRDQISIISWS